MKTMKSIVLSSCVTIAVIVHKSIFEKVVENIWSSLAF